jgi:AbrB family looped-hinge helix DNA binding protein
MKAIIVLQPNGRIVIPSKIRQQLDLGSGHRLEVTVKNGRIILTPQIDHLREAQALLSKQVGDDTSRWSDELISERRSEAERD